MSAPEIAELVRVRAALLCEHTVAPAALAAFPGLRELRVHLQTLCAAPDAGPVERAMLGNAFAREGRYLDAIASYEAAVSAEPRFAEAHLAIAELAAMLRDEERSARHFARAFALRRVFLDPAPLGERVPVVLLLRDAAYSANAPLELLLDRSRVALHKVYAAGDAALPPHAAAVVATGYALDALPVLERIEQLTAHERARIVNDPNRISTTAREHLREVLGGIADVVACETYLIDASALPYIKLPSLVRPRDTHAGRGLALVANARELREHAARFPAAAYHVSRPLDYRSGDRLFRKYRAIAIGGVPYPYHLAISPRWMVHYQGSPMREHDWMRDEERQFLERPDEVVPGFSERLGAIARASGLDYVGIDFAVMPDRTIAVFEIDAAMLVHDESPDDVFCYKRPYVARIREALHALIAERARS